MSATLLKKDSGTGVFLESFAKSLRTPVFTELLQWLLRFVIYGHWYWYLVRHLSKSHGDHYHNVNMYRLKRKIKR